MRSGSIRAWIGVGVVSGAAFVPGCAARNFRQVSCRVSQQSAFILEAQAVPSATLIPCVAPLPEGWSEGGSDVRSGIARFWLDSDRAGTHAAEITLTRACDVSRAVEGSLASAPEGLRRYDEPDALHPHSSIRYYLFRGGCVTYRLSFTRQTSPVSFEEADDLLGFTPRSLYVKSIRDRSGLTLCGADAPPCPG